MEGDLEVIAYLKSMYYVSYLPKGLRLKRQYPFIRAVGAECAAEDLAYLQMQPYIEHIAYGGKVFMLEQGGDATVLNHSTLAPDGLTGKGIGLCVMDTGINPHIDFLMPKNRLVAFKDIIGGRERFYDDNGHGTFVAGVAAGGGIAGGKKYVGPASECDIVGVKVIRESGECGVFDVLDGMQWILNNHKKYNVKVVCMSFGSEQAGKADPLTRGAQALIKNGMSVVCASGNSGKNTLKSPASCPTAIAVGALAANGTVADFTSDGIVEGHKKPELYANGVDVIGAGLKTAYVSMSGTSVAAPRVAGAVIGLYQQYPWLEPWQAKHLLMEQAEKFGFLKQK